MGVESAVFCMAVTVLLGCCAPLIVSIKVISQSHLVAASLELHQGGGDGWVLVRQVHQAGLVFDGVELEQNLFVQLDPSLEDTDQDLILILILLMILILILISDLKTGAGHSRLDCCEQRFVLDEPLLDLTD